MPSVSLGQTGWFEAPCGSIIEGIVVEVSTSGYVVKGKRVNTNQDEELHRFYYRK